jgi:opacity protein-like surface antigen
MFRKSLAGWPRLGILGILCIANPLPASAGSAYDGWRGTPAYGTPYTAYKAGLWDASDRPLERQYTSPAYAPISVDWSGLYVGGHLGATWGSFEIGSIGSADASIAEFSGGLQAGYNIQTGSIVGGLELDVTWLGSDGDTTSIGARSLTASSDWLSSARLRLGFASGNWLYFATAGMALGDITLETRGGGSSDTSSETMFGYALGGGVEYKFSPNLSARVEALYYGFGDEEVETSFGRADVDADVTTIRAGLTYRFN